MPSRKGREILAALQTTYTQAQAEIRTAASREDWPPEYRRKQRQDALTKAQQATNTARSMFATWASETEQDAIRRWSAPLVGSVADETRRARLEAMTTRLIAQGQAQDARLGVSRSGKELAARAEAMYLDGDYDQAIALAEAATALGTDAGAVRSRAETQLKLNDPDHAEAYEDLVEVRSRTFDLEQLASGGLFQTLTAAADAAKAVGDDPYAMTRDAARLSLSAKTAAWAQSLATGTEYIEPAGVLPGRPARDLGAES